MGEDKNSKREGERPKGHGQVGVNKHGTGHGHGRTPKALDRRILEAGIWRGQFVADAKAGDEAFKIRTRELAATISAKGERGAEVSSVGTPKVDNRESLRFSLEVVNSGETRVGVDKTASGDVARDRSSAKNLEIDVHELAEGSGGASRERADGGSGRR